MAKLIVELKKSHLFLVLLALSMVMSFGLGVNYASSDPSTFGHDVSEIGIGTFGGEGDYKFPGTSRVGIGSDPPRATLDVAGDIKLGPGSATCNANRAGTMRYSSGQIEYCDGSS